MIQKNTAVNTKIQLDRFVTGDSNLLFQLFTQFSGGFLFR
jgi:hypothetical protein